LQSKEPEIIIKKNQTFLIQINFKFCILVLNKPKNHKGDVMKNKARNFATRDLIRRKNVLATKIKKMSIDLKYLADHIKSL